MGVVLLQILQWILRILLFLLLLIVVLIAIVLLVPVRYKAEGEFLEKRPGIRGKITWFFYLIYMKFAYEEEFHIVVRVFGFKVYDSGKEPEEIGKNSNAEMTNGTKTQNCAKADETETAVNNTVEEANDTVETVTEKQTDAKSNGNEVQLGLSDSGTQNAGTEYSLADFEKEMESEAIEEAKIADTVLQNQNTSSSNEEDSTSEKEKKSLFEKIEDIKLKICDIIQKMKDIITKIQEGKLKAEHYLELWNKKETQITFSRAKCKLGKMIKAILPRKWNITGEVGFANPCTTGQLMGVLGAMYPMIGSHVQIEPYFEEEIMNIKGNVKGHIRLGNLVYQLASLILNIHCFKLIKLVLDELSGSKKSEKQSNSKKSKKET